CVTSNEPGIEGSPPLLFTGWFTDNVQGLALEGERPRLEGVNLLAIHLPAPGPPDSLTPTGVFRPTRRSDPFNSSGFSGNRVNPYALGVMSYSQRQYKSAETWLRRAVASNPSDFNAYNQLAYALAQQNKLDQALVAAQTALRLSPNSGNILDTVGEMYQRKN